MEYILIRSKRKTAAIYIRNGEVEVRAPLKMPKRDIDRFIQSKEKWITDKLSVSSERAAQRDAFTLYYGDRITLRGACYPLIGKPGTRAGFDGDSFYLPLNLAPGQIKSVCIQIYRRLAKIHLTERTAAYAAQMGVTPAAVKVTSAITRWGSCSSKRSINFSWRLIMAEDMVIDYVVVHELAHLIEMNHSAGFWSIVGRVLPDYQTRRARLRELQKKLATENWE